MPITRGLTSKQALSVDQPKPPKDYQKILKAKKKRSGTFQQVPMNLSAVDASLTAANS